VTNLPSVELTVYPYECDAFGHLNEASFLALFERARWDALARGPGMNVFQRNGVWPAVRKATVDYKAGAFPGDILTIETVVTHRGTTSMTLRQVATRGSDGVVVAEAEIVFVCIDRLGRSTPMPDELVKIFGPRTSGASPREVQRHTVNGVELACDVRGEGTPVLFIHGFPFDRTMWRHQLAMLARWKRIAPDLRGAGGSGAPPDGYSLARYADDLVALLDALGVRQAVVCGLSMGGYITLELLRRHADRIRALILMDTRARADSPESRRSRDELARLAQAEGPAAVADRLLPRLLAPDTPVSQPEVVTQVREMAARLSVPGTVGALLAMRDRKDASDLLPKITVPTLVLAGAEDQITPPQDVRALAAAIPGARFTEIPAAGHLAPLEQPLATARALGDFLQAL